MTLKEQMAIYFGNTEDSWSSSDESEDKEINSLSLLSEEEKKENRIYREKYGCEKPREHHSW
jgi:hypothetical protein